MVRCDVVLTVLGLGQRGAEQVFVTPPKVGEELLVTFDGEAVSDGEAVWCRVDMVRHIAENALRNSPQASITIFVSPV